ncbi:TlpA family protein disulfide reductase [Psychroserpens sp. MEBiC05023]
MKHIVYILITSFLAFGNGAEYSDDTDQNSTSEVLKVFDFEELQSYLEAKQTDKTYVINFWATWCAPCVKELPYFEQLQSNYSGKDVEVILVSLDFPNQLDTRLKPFLKKHDLKSEVIVLDDVDSNTWIPKVSKDWTGAIPATIIYNSNKKRFYERSFNYQELESELKQFIK